MITNQALEKLKSDLEKALIALDEYACWGYAPTMEPLDARGARKVLAQIRGGDGHQGTGHYTRVGAPPRVTFRVQFDAKVFIPGETGHSAVKEVVCVDMEAENASQAADKVGVALNALIRESYGARSATPPLRVTYECPEHGKQDEACCEGARRKEHVR